MAKDSQLDPKPIEKKKLRADLLWLKVNMMEKAETLNISPVIAINLVIISNIV